MSSGIARLATLYRDCEDKLVARRAHGFERIRGGGPGGVNLDEEAVAARSGLLGVAASWSGLVVGERGLTSRPGREIGELSSFLLSHLGWLVQHPAVGDALSEITDALRAAEAALEPRLSPALALGLCAEPGCRGRISATAQHVGCDQGHQFQPRQWLLLRHRLEQAL